MKAVTRRVSTVAIATLLAAPMGAGIASAEVVDPDTGVTEEGAGEGGSGGSGIGETGTGEEGSGESGGGETGTGESGTGEEGTGEGGSGESGTGEEGTGEGGSGEEGSGEEGSGEGGSGEEGSGEEGSGEEGSGEGGSDEDIVVGEYIAIGFVGQYESLLTWAPSGNYSTQITGLVASGQLPDGGALVTDIPVTWSYSLNGGEPVDFVPVDGTYTVSGLVEGANTLELTATYTPAVDAEALVAAQVAESLVSTETQTVTVQTMAETIADLQADSLPEYTIDQGETGTFVAAEGFFTAGETVTVTLVPVGGGAPITVGTGVAAADGSFSYDLSVPADLASGDYYLVAEGGTSGTLGYALLHVGAGSINDNGGTNTVGDTTTTAPVDTVDTASQLAVTGSNPATGLLVGTLVTLAGAGTVFGVRRFQLGRADV